MKKIKKILIASLSLAICFQVSGIFNITKAYANNDEALTNDSSDVNLEENTGAIEEEAAGNVGVGENTEPQNQSENPEVNLLPEIENNQKSLEKNNFQTNQIITGIGDPIINEIDYDQHSVDNAEFIEIKNLENFPINLNGYSLQLINGEGGGAAIYRTIILPDINLPANDYYVICGNAATVINCDLDVSPDTNLIQNGAPDAIALVYLGTILDTVSYEGNTAAPYTEGSGALADSGISVKGISRYPDGNDTNQNNVDFFLRIITPGTANYAGQPTGGEVYDGLAGDIQYSNDSSQLSANWSGFVDVFGIDYYEYAFGTSAGADDIVDWQVTNNTSAVEPVSLTEGQKYYASVRAYNIYGDVSDIVSSDGVTIDITPPDSQSIIINDDDQYTSSQNVKIKVSAIDNISGVEEVLLSEDQLTWMIYPYTSSEIDYTLLNNATNGEKIIYAKFRDAVSNESPTINDSIILDTQPPTPPILNAKPGDGYVDLSWTEAIDNNEIDHYDIYRSGSPYQWIAKTDADILEYKDEDVENGGNYTYSVIAVDKAGNPQFPDVGIPEQDLSSWIIKYGSDPITVTPSKIAEVVGQITEVAAKTEAVGFIPVAQAAPAEEGKVKGEESIKTEPEEELPAKEEVQNWPMIIAILIASLIIIAGLWYYWIVTRPANQYLTSEDRRKSRRRSAKRLNRPRPPSQASGVAGRRKGQGRR